MDLLNESPPDTDRTTESLNPPNHAAHQTPWPFIDSHAHKIVVKVKADSLLAVHANACRIHVLPCATVINPSSRQTTHNMNNRHVRRSRLCTTQAYSYHEPENAVGVLVFSFPMA